MIYFIWLWVYHPTTCAYPRLHHASTSSITCAPTSHHTSHHQHHHITHHLNDFHFQQQTTQQQNNTSKYRDRNNRTTSPQHKFHHQFHTTLQPLYTIHTNTHNILSKRMNTLANCLHRPNYPRSFQYSECYHSRRHGRENHITHDKYRYI